MISTLEVRQAIDNSGSWLLKIQDKDNGGWADQPGRTPSTLNTAEAIIALIDGGISRSGHKPIQKAVEFLLSHKRCPEGPDKGAWPREVQPEHGEKERFLPDLVRSSFAIQALIKAGIGADKAPVKDAADWICDIQNADDGGWGFRRGSPSLVSASCFALMALLAVYKAGVTECKASIESGLEFLDKHCRRENGAFQDREPFVAVHTIYAALALQAARRSGFPGYHAQETQAIAWLLRNPDRAFKQVEEEINIDPATGKSGNYRFSYMSDSLLLRVLMGSDDNRHRNSETAQQVMNSIKDKQDENTGGFYGYRLFSWSTAKIVSALSAAGAYYPAFPTRAPEYPGLKIGHLLFGFIILLAAAAVYLAANGSFGVVEAVFFVFLVLVSLLVYRFIGEKTFVELFRLTIAKFKKI